MAAEPSAPPPTVGLPTADANIAVAPLQGAQRIWIGTHVDPDGDAIGSLLGLGRVLRATGRELTLACADPAAPDLRFLPGAEGIVAERPDPKRHDLAVALDAGDAGRLGSLYDEGLWQSMNTLVIDHHVSNTGFADLNLIDANAASTAEILVRVLDELGLPFDRAAATCLLTGIVTDTIGFRTPNTKPGTLEAARRLMLAGAPLAEITQRIFSTRPMGALRLQSRALERMRLESPFAVASITLADMAEFNVGPDEARGISSFLATAAEPIAVAVLREREDGDIDVSMRARPGTSLVPAAEALGGGGHALASGARVSGPLAAAEQAVMAALQDHVVPPAQEASR